MGTPPPSPNRPNRVPTTGRRSTGALGRIRERVAGAGLVRPANDGVLAGVLAGVAVRLGVSPWLLRGLFLLSMFLPGPQFVLYLVLWAVMPRASTGP
jgi:phage shock protein PspC (stress-responsive transcriptional regulator)